MNLRRYLKKDWKAFLGQELNSELFQKIEAAIEAEKKSYKIFPPVRKIFAAFNETPLKKVKVIIIGQDPYHGKRQANGLSFSVSEGIKQPPSLKNIFRELHNDLKIPISEHGNLLSWARQGVLLLNAILTVREKQAGSHQKIGWETITDSIIEKLSKEKNQLIFMLWGNFAISKEKLIDEKKHFILKAAHPSPFSAYNGFLGCRHFSKANEILINLDKEPINWAI